MCYPDIPTHCVHLLATLLRVIFQWWGGPPWAGRQGRVHFFRRRCKKCAIRSPSKYHDTLQFDEARFFSPSNLFPQEGIGFTHEDEQGSQELETGDWKTEDLVVAVGIWRSVQRFLTGFVLDFIRSIIFLKLKSPNPDTNSWLVGYGFAGCFFVLWVFSHPIIYTSS